MSKVVTSVTAIVENELTDAECDQIIASSNSDNLSEVAESMEESVESIIAQRVFGDADNIVALEVNTEVEE